jgi:hypothetical protein
MCQDLEKMSRIPGENMQTYSEYALGKVEDPESPIIEVQISPSLQSRESAPTDESLRQGQEHPLAANKPGSQTTPESALNSL